MKRPGSWELHAALQSGASEVEIKLSSAAEIRVLTTPQELFAAAGDEVIRLATEAVSARGLFTIALSGGSTPKEPL